MIQLFLLVGQIVQWGSANLKMGNFHFSLCGQVKRYAEAIRISELIFLATLEGIVGPYHAQKIQNFILILHNRYEETRFI